MARCKLEQFAIRSPWGLAPQVKVGGRTLLKLIDEYNYAKYTKGWI
jgi:hypothetical protein